MNIKARFTKLVVHVFGDIQFFKSPFHVILWGDTHYRVKGPEIRHILDTIQPGDILLRRYHRYVSGWFIPGYYTHVAIYVGDGKIIHATTHDVCDEDILTFCRADEIAVLRPKVTDEVKQIAVDMAKSIIGREYDFLFDGNDDQRFYCSEVPKYCYSGVFDDIGSNKIPPDAYLNAGMEVIHESKNFN